MLIPEIVFGLMLTAIIVALFRIDAAVGHVSERLDRVARALEGRPGPGADPARSRAQAAQTDKAAIVAALAAARLAADSKGRLREKTSAEPARTPGASASSIAYDGASGGLIDVFGDSGRAVIKKDAP